MFADGLDGGVTGWWNVVSAMYDALRRFGFSQGRLLEPALGLGHFIGLMPDDMHTRTRITGIEIDSVTVRLARLLYPDADIRHKPFPKTIFERAVVSFFG